MMEKIYYSPKGFWKGLPAVEKLAKQAKVSKKQALEFLKKQAVWQIYLPPPKKIIRPRFARPPQMKFIRQICCLSHDTVNRKTYKYALTVVDIESIVSNRRSHGLRKLRRRSEIFTSES